MGVVLGFTCACSPAYAVGAHVLRSEFNGSKTEAHEFKRPKDVTVDQRTGNVFVTDSGRNVIDGFNAAGEAPAGSPPQLTGLVPPAPPSSFHFEGEPSQVAVDESVGGFSSGDVYVSDSKNGVVDKFKLNGAGTQYEYVCQLTGYEKGCVAEPSQPPTWVEPDGVAVDNQGNVYVAIARGPEAGIEEFNSEGVDVKQILASPEHPVLATGEPVSLAIDATGNIYVQNFNTDVLKITPEGAESLIDSNHSTAVAVGPEGEVYVDDETYIAEYSAAGEKVGEFGRGHLKESFGVAINNATREVYVSDANELAPTVDVYEFDTKPLIDGEWTTNVTATSAQLHALINPVGFDTHYYFEYCGAGQCAGTAAPPGIDLGAGEGDQFANAAISGLKPGTTYEYRVIAGPSVGSAHVLTTSSAAEAPSACANEQLRKEANSLSLPDCRAFELVSPPDKAGGSIVGIDGISSGGIVQAAEEGTGITYLSLNAFDEPAGAQGGSQYLSTRGASGWVTANITPPTKASAEPGPENERSTPYNFFSPDLSSAVLDHADPPLPPFAPEAPVDYHVPYVRDNLTGVYQPLIPATTHFNLPPAKKADEQHFEWRFGGATADGSHVIFAANDALTPGTHFAPESGHNNLYEWFAGKLYPINVLPGGESRPGAEFGGVPVAGSGDAYRALSSDGSSVVWTDRSEGEGKTRLYVRENSTSPAPTTVPVDESHVGGELGGAGVYQAASSDVSKVFFTDEKHLTESSEPGNSPNLYAFTLGTRALTDLTGGIKEPGVVGVLGASEDGSYVYFVAEAGVDGASRQKCGEVRTGGTGCNLYVWHEGEGIHFIAMLSPADEENVGVGDWNALPADRTARVSSDGTRVVFMSQNSLTGYDNNDVQEEVKEGVHITHPDQEVYLYEATAGVLRCVSCNRTGARPIGRPEALEGRWAAAEIPAATSFGQQEGIYLSHVLSNDGKRVFFDSTDALASGATNGVKDVYEWEEAGAGSCPAGSQEGCVYLISGGTGEQESVFLDASGNGDDVFFLTANALVGQDIDENADVYDSRVGGGFPAPLSEVPVCNEESCKAPPAQASQLETPASGVFPAGENVVTHVVTQGSGTGARRAKLAAELKVCRARRNRRKRRACEAAARRRYAKQGRAQRYTPTRKTTRGGK